MENKKMIIAIDGPGAAGKSTVAKLLAQKLNYTYIDTGAMYRCLALYALRNNIDANNVEGLIKASEDIEIFLDESNKVFLNNEDVTLAIRHPDVSRLASPVSCPRPVREIFVTKQRNLAKKAINGVVMDGRDIGTVVFPDANIKIYQVASCDERAKRRYIENVAKGINVPLEKIKEDIEKRDYTDMSKGYGALKKASDAIELDTTNMSIQEVVDFIYNKVLESK